MKTSTHGCEGDVTELTTTILPFPLFQLLDSGGVACNGHTACVSLRKCFLQDVEVIVLQMTGLCTKRRRSGGLNPDITSFLVEQLWAGLQEAMLALRPLAESLGAGGQVTTSLGLTPSPVGVIAFLLCPGHRALNGMRDLWQHHPYAGQSCGYLVEYYIFKYIFY